MDASAQTRPPSPRQAACKLRLSTGGGVKLRRRVEHSDQQQRGLCEASTNGLETILAAIATRLAGHVVEKNAVRLTEWALVEDARGGGEKCDAVAGVAELCKRERAARGPANVGACTCAVWGRGTRGKQALC